MKTDACLCDYEVELTTPTETRVLTIGYSPSIAEAATRARSVHPEATNARVLRVLVEHAPDSTPLSELKVFFEPVENCFEKLFILRDSKGRDAAAEMGGGHMLTAYEFLMRAKPGAAWKTAKLLKTLRQAIREDTANCHSDDLDSLLAAAPTQFRVMRYLQLARARDVAHHGVRTF